MSSTVVASGLFVAVVLLSGCGGPSAKSSGIRKSFEKAFPEAQFTVSCRDDLGPDSSSDYDCKVLWGPRDQKLSVRETYEWQKRLQRHDLRDYRTWHHLMPGIVPGDRIVPLSIHCKGVTERHGGYPSFDLVLAYPESGGPPGAKGPSRNNYHEGGRAKTEQDGVRERRCYWW